MFGIRMMMVSVAMMESAQASGDSFGIILVVEWPGIFEVGCSSWVGFMEYSMPKREKGARSGA